MQLTDAVDYAEGAPADLVINTHVCRGNYESCFAASGAYDPIAPILFTKENVNAFYLEYDDERSGGFEPLKYVTGDKKVVLGLACQPRQRHQTAHYHDIIHFFFHSSTISVICLYSKNKGWKNTFHIVKETFF